MKNLARAKPWVFALFSYGWLIPGGGLPISQVRICVKDATPLIFRMFFNFAVQPYYKENLVIFTTWEVFPSHFLHRETVVWLQSCLSSVFGSFKFIC